MPPFAFRGVIAAIVTPVDRRGDPDTGAFVELAQWLLANGCDGLNVLGTTGEATSLSCTQRVSLMESLSRSNLPFDRMMVGTGAAAVADAVMLNKTAADCGFAGSLILPQFYYKNVPECGIVRYFQAIADATRGSRTGLLLYNFPALSGIAYSVPLVQLLMREFGERVVGLKDSSGDLAYARAVAELSKSFSVFPSNEACLAEARNGSFAGCISATANLNSAYCAKAFHGGDDVALSTAVRIRNLFDGKQLVPSIKGLLSVIHGRPQLADVLPPFAQLGENDIADLRKRYMNVAV